MTRSESLVVADLLLFKAILKDDSESAVNIIERFDLKPDHKILGLCEPMSFIAQNFLEISKIKYGDHPRRDTRGLSVISILEEETVDAFCQKGVHAVDLAITIDALTTFHAILDAGHKDVTSNSVYLSIKHLKPDMLLRLYEEGYDLWGINAEWSSRPIDTIISMGAFKDDLLSMQSDDAHERLAECLQIVLNARKDNECLIHLDKRKEHPTLYNGGRVLRHRSFGVPELDCIMSLVTHGLDL